MAIFNQDLSIHDNLKNFESLKDLNNLLTSFDEAPSVPLNMMVLLKALKE